MRCSTKWESNSKSSMLLIVSLVISKESLIRKKSGKLSVNNSFEFLRKNKATAVQNFSFKEPLHQIGLNQVVANEMSSKVITM